MDNDEFLEKVKSLVGNEYTFLEPYQNCRNPILCRHNKCGLKFKVMPYYFLNKPRCPLCLKGSMIKPEVVRFILAKYGYELLNKNSLLKSNSELIIRHKYCGNVRKVNTKQFLRSTECRKCKFTKELQSYLDTQTNHRYEVLSNYVNNESMIKIRHRECGFVYQTTPHSLRRGQGRCPKCFSMNFRYIVRKKQGLSNLQFEDRVKKLVGEEYTFLDDYVNAYTKLTCKHNKCGFIFKVCPHDFYKGSGCPKCSSSKGELFVKSYLDSINCLYEREFKFLNLKDKSNLRFDFYIPSMKTAIEYDGIQHYKPQGLFGGIDGFNNLKKHDSMKDVFCDQHRIRLIRISYKYNTYDKVRKRLEQIL